MTTLTVFDGDCLDLKAPDPRHIHTIDIVRSLTRLPRFCGRRDLDWTVAQHSILVMHLVSQQRTASVPLLLAALLHDAHEAYVSDIPSPVKEIIHESGPGLRNLTDRLDRAIYTSFGLPACLPMEWRIRISIADLEALEIEDAYLDYVNWLDTDPNGGLLGMRGIPRNVLTRRCHIAQIENHWFLKIWNRLQERLQQEVRHVSS